MRAISFTVFDLPSNVVDSLLLFGFDSFVGDLLGDDSEVGEPVNKIQNNRIVNEA